MRCHPSICPFKRLHAFFLFFWQLTLFSYIIFHLYYNNKSNNLAQWWPHKRSKTKRLEVRGSIPASSKLHFSYLFTGNLVCMQVCNPPCAFLIKRARWPDLVVSIKGPPYAGQRMSTGSEKVTWISHNGPAKLLSTPPKSGPISLSLTFFLKFNYFIWF